MKFRQIFYFLIFLLFLSSCTTLDSDNSSRPIPEQPGRKTTLLMAPKNVIPTEILPLHTIENPVNHESGWDNDDKVLVFKSPLIKSDSQTRIYFWYSDSQWTRFRLSQGFPFGYSGGLLTYISDGEIRICCGSRGQFLVNLNSIYLVYSDI